MNSSQTSVIKILPQYGSVTAAFFAPYRGLLSGASEASIRATEESLVRPHELDRFLNTSAQDVLNATHSLPVHQVVAALEDQSESLRETLLQARLSASGSSTVLELSFKNQGLRIRMGVGPDAVTTRGYVIETDTAGLQDFIKASLHHYRGVPDRFFDGTPDFATATTDDIMLAASLIYHQQFLMDGAKGPFDFMDVARALTVSDQLKTGQNQEHAWVPSQKGDREHPVDVERFADGRVQITIHNTADHGRPNMPLFGNVLVMGARELSNGFRAMPFLDLLG